QNQPFGHAETARRIEIAERDGLNASAKRLGEIAAIDQAEGYDCRYEGMKFDMPLDHDPDKQRQDEMHPYQHDVVGCIAEQLYVEGADEARREKMVHPHKRCAEPRR